MKIIQPFSRSFSVIVLALLPLAASADLSVTCNVASHGALVGTCHTRVSGSAGTGEIKLDGGEVYRMASDAKCPLGEYDVRIENVAGKKDARDSQHPEFSVFTTSAQNNFKVAIVTYKNGNLNQPKVKNSGTYGDMGNSPYVTITGRIQYEANGSGVDCSISNH